MKKLNLLIVFGGKSSEHSVSVWSANNVIKAVDKSKYALYLIYIDKHGNWFKIPNDFEINEKSIAKNLNKFNNAYLMLKNNKGVIFNLQNKKTSPIDVCFPILHGLNGEDGTIQGLLKLYNIKFVGSDVLGSCINMDKVIGKRLLKSTEIKIAKFIDFKKHEQANWNFEKLKKILNAPFFIKPVNTGSSIGISKVHNKKEFTNAIKKAFKHANKIIAEEEIKGREIECSVLGNTHPIASLIGEIIPEDEFYSYEDKCVNTDNAKLIIPAKLSKSQIKKIQKVALESYQLLECSGFARADMFLTKNNEIYLNEINTIPGFTNISMFPKLWNVSGLEYAQLINILISLALKN